MVRERRFFFLFLKLLTNAKGAEAIIVKAKINVNELVINFF